MKRNAFPTVQSQVDYVNYSYQARRNFRKDIARNMIRYKQKRLDFLSKINLKECPFNKPEIENLKREIEEYYIDFPSLREEQGGY